MRVLACLLALVATVAAADTPPPFPIDCDGVRDGAAEMQRLLDAGAGGEVLVPPHCTVLLGHGVVIPSDTTVRCRGTQSGFAAAARRCGGGAFDGAACASDADCGAGACRTDAGGVFAPDAGRDVAMLAAAPGSARVRVVGCDLWTRQIEPYYRCADGRDAGKPCLHVCADDPAHACDQDADCHGRCLGVDVCAPNGDTDACHAEPGRPSGPGGILPLDLSGSTDAVVEDVRVHDQRAGRFAIAVGGGWAAVRFSDTTRQDRNPWPVSFTDLDAWNVIELQTGAGIVGSGGAQVVGNRVAARGTGIDVAGADALVRDNLVTVGAPTGAIGIHVAGARARVLENGVTVKESAADARGIVFGGQASDVSHNVVAAQGDRSVGIYAAAGQGRVIANQVGAFVGFSGDPHDGINTLIADNRFFSGAGPKLILSGAGMMAIDNYLAWDARALGACDGGPQADAICDTATGCADGRCGDGGTCVGGARAGARCDCPGATCSRFPVVQLGSRDAVAAGTAHAVIRGNLIQGTNGADGIRFEAPGQRCADGPQAMRRCAGSTRDDCPGACTAGPNAGKACRAASDCACATPADCGGTPCDGGRCREAKACLGGGRCAPTLHVAATIADNSFVPVNGGAAVDASRLVAGAGTSIKSLAIAGNRAFDGVAVGVQLPAPENCTDCNILGNDFGPVRDKLRGWDWRMGTVADNGALDPDDDQVQLVTCTNTSGGPLVAGEAVEAGGPGSSNGCRRAAAGAAAVLGIALAPAEDGAPVRVGIAGLTNCAVVPGQVVSGTRLAVRAPGQGAAADAAEAAYAIALSDQAAGAAVRCAVRSFAPAVVTR